jgi:hypothetical protein
MVSIYFEKHEQDSSERVNEARTASGGRKGRTDTVRNV